MPWRGRYAKGLKRDRNDPRDFPFQHIKKLLTAKAGTPSATMDLRPCASTVRDQGQLGSCTGFAIIVGLWEFLKITTGVKPYVPGSPLFEYYQERVLEGDVPDDNGAEIRDGMSQLANIGCCSEKLWPYDISQFAVAPPAAAVADAANHKITSYYRVNSLGDVQAALAAIHPVVIGINVYESFESPSADSSGVIPIPNVSTEQLLGGHAICLVGYNLTDAQWKDVPAQSLIFKNSWGQGWGAAGYGFLPAAYWSMQDATGPLVSDQWMGVK